MTHAGKIEAQLQTEVAELLPRAETAGQSGCAACRSPRSWCAARSVWPAGEKACPAAGLSFCGIAPRPSRHAVARQRPFSQPRMPATYALAMARAKGIPTGYIGCIEKSRVYNGGLRLRSQPPATAIPQLPKASISQPFPFSFARCRGGHGRKIPGDGRSRWRQHRMKDPYDTWLLSGTCQFGDELSRAIAATRPADRSEGRRSSSADCATRQKR
jgi:hypothetical protein